MGKKNLIGKKVRGFRFDPYPDSSLFYSPRMEPFVGEIGTIRAFSPNGNVRVRFRGDEEWSYPLDQIEQHLVEDTPSQYEVGMTVHDYEYGEGVIVRINERMTYPIEVRFKMHSENYTMEGESFKSPMNSTLPRLSLTPYDLVNGGATFPTFKPELPGIEKGTLVYVKNLDRWEMRYFSHFDEDEGIHCFISQSKEGDTIPWTEYSLTNPLIEEK